MVQNISNPGNSYLIQLQGALRSPAIYGCGDVTITSPETDGTLRLRLTIQLDSLRDLLYQFQNFSLQVLPTDGTDPKNSARVDPMVFTIRRMQ